MDEQLLRLCGNPQHSPCGLSRRHTATRSLALGRLHISGTVARHGSVKIPPSHFFRLLSISDSKATIPRRLQRCLPRTMDHHHLSRSPDDSNPFRAQEARRPLRSTLSFAQMDPDTSPTRNPALDHWTRSRKSRHDSHASSIATPRRLGRTQ